MAHWKLLPALLALVISAASPVFGYFNLHVGAHGEIIEHCPADEFAGADAQHDHSSPHDGSSPRCLYCAGFAAGMALGQFVPQPARPVLIAIDSQGTPLAAFIEEASLRIAQPRAPPSTL